MNKLNFLILFLHFLTGNEDWMDGNKLTEASAYYGNFDTLLENLRNDNLGFNLETDKNYFYQHLGTTEDELKQLNNYEIEYEADFSRGRDMVNVDLGFGDDVKILKRDDRDVYYVRFNPNKLYNETINITKENTVANSTGSGVNSNDNNVSSSNTKNESVPQHKLGMTKQITKDILLSLGIFATIFGFIKNSR